MRHVSFPGIGKRIKERLLALGYQEAGEPQIGRFIREHRYDGRYFYPWLKDRTPSGDNLERLATDLRCSRAWLLLGEGPEPEDNRPARRRRVPAPITGGSASVLPDGGTPRVAQDSPRSEQNQDALHLIRRFAARIHAWLWPLVPQPQFAC